MVSMMWNWQKLGAIVKPSSIYPLWLRNFTGATAVVEHGSPGLFWFYITGRDDYNKSHIGRILVDLNHGPAVVYIEEDVCFSHGRLGTFDEDGVSYPCLIEARYGIDLFYTGWVATRSTGFQNHLGKAYSIDGGKTFKRYSKAPILARNDSEPYSIGSVFVMQDNELWKMWYTSFVSWEKKDDNTIQHKYLIRYAESEDGFSWFRDYENCIDFDKGEFAICRPTVIKLNGIYHMWFCARGNEYRLCHAISKDGRSWKRLYYNIVPSSSSKESWDSHSQCYPAAFRYSGYLYLLYSGNGYGKEGLGLIRISIDALSKIPDLLIG
ncbi:hypothetical protein GCM10007160_37630 [Litchfieldella qijiaojingensis]|uniref:Glycosyl hydrolase family 32 N-terminal domain-containing protein n=1 Tax=Litchfieldella qijiaojingensis TaxID=980347 RepID=A0ABQ2Z6W8_9GAMM|nr:hypothetical protein [Halomonas qijiaojingensis]GGY06541.1 hypothetical protein GCM10007160_37630 [Halomonas qijiaojingensis]